MPHICSLSLLAEALGKPCCELAHGPEVLDAAVRLVLDALRVR